jgi:hypothetical protein
MDYPFEEKVKIFKKILLFQSEEEFSVLDKEGFI